MSIETATAIARLVREHGGRALRGRRVGARSAARPAGQGRRRRGLRPPRGATEGAARRPSRPSTPSARASPSTRSSTSTSRCRAASRRSAAAIARSTSAAIPDMAPEEAARRRDFTVNAIAWDPLTDTYLDPFDGRRRSARAPGAARRRSAHLRRRQPARAARHSVRRPLRASRWMPDTKEICRAHPARRSAGRADLGRDREAAAPRRTARRSASRWRSSSASSTGSFPS